MKQARFQFMPPEPQRSMPSPAAGGRVHLGTELPQREVTLLGKWGCSMQFCAWTGGRWVTVPKPADPTHRLPVPNRWMYANE